MSNLCPSCFWYENPFDGQNCQQRFGVTATTTTCDEWETWIPIGMLLVMVQNDPTNVPVWAFAVGDFTPTSFVALGCVAKTKTIGNETYWMPTLKIKSMASRSYHLQLDKFRASRTTIKVDVFKPASHLTTVPVQTKTVWTWRDSYNRQWTVAPVNPFYRVHQIDVNL